MLESECSMFLNRIERASCGAWGTRGMFRSDEYDGGAFWEDGGCGVPKSRGAGDEDRDCTDRDVSSFIRFVLKTCRKRSVISWASWSVSTLASAARWAACECSISGIANCSRSVSGWWVWLGVSEERCRVVGVEG
jgi:hypothetical protein